MNGTANAADSSGGPPLPKLRAKGARLLSLDGGGVKGVSSVVILDAIMEKVKERELKLGINKSQGTRKPCDYFDLAGGTSTGGLIALMLFRLKMDTKQCLDAYHGMASQIFAPTLLWSRKLGSFAERVPGFTKLALMSNVWWKGAQFSGKPLQDAIKKIVDNYSDFNDKLRYNLVHPSSKFMFMCATLKDEGESMLLRSYTRPKDACPITHKAQDDDIVNTIDIVSAARATSAAPMYLPEEVWPNEKVSLKEGSEPLKFWDGGVLNNNPVDQVYNCRYDLVGIHDAPPPVKCMVSIGCSRPDPEKPRFATRILNTISRYTEYYMANTEAKGRDFERLVQRMNDRQEPNIQYFRLDCPTHSTRFDMADYRIMGKLEEMTKEHLKSKEAHEKVLEIAKLLADPE